jgi:hypothetical protein
MTMFSETERDKADEALSNLPPLLRMMFMPHFHLAGSQVGTYAGLVCRMCEHWSDGQHADDCPLRGLRVTPQGHIVGTEE